MKKIVIIGAGASGLMCAIRIKQQAPNNEVILLEAKNRIGKKILQTGNGKCNLSNLNTNGLYYNNKHFVEKALAKVSINDVLDLFNNLGLMVRYDNEGRVYPYSENASTILEVLRRAIEKYNIESRLEFEVINISKNKNKYIVSSLDDKIECDVLVIATGSMAQSNQNGYDLLKQLNHHITKLHPGLVPLKTKENLSHLQGIRVKCRATIIDGKDNYNNQGEILFKKDGLSGILSLDLSRYYQEGSKVSLDLIPEIEISELRNIINRSLKDYSLEEVLMGYFPKMLVYDLIKKNSNDISYLIKNYIFEISGLCGYDQAQITVGGVKVDEINEDFESKINNNMYIIGEVLDIDGACGGYNLSFAWLSGIISADAIVK